MEQMGDMVVTIQNFSLGRWFSIHIRAANVMLSEVIIFEDGQIKVGVVREDERSGSGIECGAQSETNLH